MILTLLFFLLELFYVVRCIAYGRVTIKDGNVTGGIFLFALALLIIASGVFGFFRL